MVRILLNLTIAIAMLFLMSCGLSDDTVAKVGSYEIKLAEYQKMLKQRFPNRELAQLDSAARMQVLNQLIEYHQKLQAARALKLDRDPEVVDEVENQKKRILYSNYYERVIVDSIIDLSKVNEFLEKIKEEVKASHVLIAFKGVRGSQNNRSKEEAEQLAREISAQARSGVPLTELAQKYSDDPSVKNNNGDLGYFTWGRMTDSFQRAAFAMNIGEISDPVLSEFGYHVIQLEDRRPNPFYDPENLQEPTLQIKRQLYSAKSDEGMQRWNKHIEKIKKQLNFKIETDGIDEVIIITGQKRDAGQSKMEDYTDKEKQIVLASWKGGKLLLADLFKFYEQNFNRLHSKLINQSALEQEVENFANMELAVFMARKMGLDKEKEFVRSIRQLTEQRMLSLVEKRAINDQIKVTDDEMMQYYAENKQEYINPPEIEIWEIYVTDEKLANRLFQRLQKGEDFGTLAEKYSEDKVNAEKKGYLGFRSENRRGAVSKTAMEVGENQLAGPIKYRNGWAIIKTGQLKEETVKSFEDSRGRINSKLRGIKLSQRRKEWEKEIRNKFSVKINHQLLEQIS